MVTADRAVVIRSRRKVVVLAPRWGFVARQQNNKKKNEKTFGVV